MSERILINFQAKGDKKLIQSMYALARAQGLLEKNTKQAATAQGFLATAFSRNQKNASKFSMALSTMRSKMLLFSFAMSMGGRQLIEFGKSAAKIEQMETAFNTLTGATENSSVALTRLQAATDGTMSRFDLFQQANNAMILGVTKNSTEMAEMFDMAQRLGKALGVDAKRSVESLITGIGRQSRLMLDNIGIVVKADEAYEAYAKNLGISADKLTDHQKKQAFLNATMEAARAKVATLGPETQTTADIFNQFNATAADLSELVGEVLLPFLGYLAEGFIQLGKDSKAVAEYFGWIYTASEKVTNSIATQQAEWTILSRSLQGVNEESDEFIAARDRFMEQNPNYFAGMQKEEIKVKDLQKAIEEYNRFLTQSLQIKIAEIALEGKMSEIGELARIRAERNLKAVKAEQRATKALVVAMQAVAKTGILEPEQMDTMADTMISTLRKKGAFFKQVGEENWKKFFDPEIINWSTIISRWEADSAEGMDKFAKELFAPLSKYEDVDINMIDAMTEALMEDLGTMNKDIAGLTAKIYELFGIKFDPLKEGMKDVKKEILETFATGAIESFGGALDAQLFSQLENGRMSLNGFYEDFARMMNKIIAKIIAEQAVLMLMNLILPGSGDAVKIGKSVMHEGGPIKGYIQGGLIPRYSSGGSVDNVPIMAQEGEFMMRRSAVESIGLENMNRMNQTGQASGGVNVTFKGNVLSKQFIEREAIPAIKDAVRRGAKLGI